MSISRRDVKMGRHVVGSLGIWFEKEKKITQIGFVQEKHTSIVCENLCALDLIAVVTFALKFACKIETN